MLGLRERGFAKGKGSRLGLFKRDLLALRSLRMSFDLCKESHEKLMQNFMMEYVSVVKKFLNGV